MIEAIADGNLQAIRQHLDGASGRPIQTPRETWRDVDAEGRGKVVDG